MRRVDYIGHTSRLGGDKPINKVTIGDGLAFEGITPASTDNEYIARGEVPPSLLYYPDNPDVHLNAKGYDLLAHLIYEQGKTLGYFN